MTTYALRAAAVKTAKQAGAELGQARTSLS